MAESSTVDRAPPPLPEKLPSWISGWGQDEYGVFVQFSIPTGQQYWEYVDQRLRWIAPGTFLMGSPESEAGRRSNEGPRHQVTLSAGFWLMETPVTQALWQQVMGENPSRFVDTDRPVESVHWRKCREFCAALSRALEGEFHLPTEAQWEYACRAGSVAATYAGDLRIEGERNAPVLHEIAWYGGNSGVAFDLDNGYDSSDWKQKQFPHEQAGTRKVASRRPNPWGLYDMLGNVWEWCEDGLREYMTDAVLDPVGPASDGAGRVFRGGSWFGLARYVRAAYRFADGPGFRDADLGFRCVAPVAE